MGSYAGALEFSYVGDGSLQTVLHLTEFCFQLLSLRSDCMQLILLVV